MKIRACVAVAVMMCAACAHAQVAPRFDVISVKPHDPHAEGMGIRVSPTSYTATNVGLDNVIASAYGVKMWLISGLPPWAKTSAWDINAKMSEAPHRALTKEETEGLMRGLLRERFGLVVHEEHKLQPVLEMTVMPNAHALTPATDMLPASDDGKPARPRGGYRMTSNSLTGSINMASLCGTLSYMLERTVINKTALPGYYDVTLRWTPDMSAAPADNGTGDAPPALIEALQQQLGLKLTAAKAEVPTVVVDAIKQPEEN